MLTVDGRMLVDSFMYYEYGGDGDGIWQGEEYAEPVEISNVRIDRSTHYSRDNMQTKIVAEAIIFCYASHTKPLKGFKEQSKVSYDGKEYIINKVVMNKEPFADKVWSYELELI